MTDTIRFYYNPMSRARSVHWMLEEVGAPYEIELIRFDRGEHKTPEFLAVNPMGKLPTIVHGKLVVTEAAAICAYLADAFPGSALAPPTTAPARGTYYRWLLFGASCIEPAVLDRMLNRAAPERKGMLGHGTYEDVVHTLEKALEPGPFLLGDRFSAADLYVASQLGWGLMTKAIEPRPAFESYVGRCRERPAAKRAAERDKAYIDQLEREKPQAP